jgi:RNA polymerase sigma-70 factor (ECF subfamily)
MEGEVALHDAARRGETGAFDTLVAPYRGELRAHCYRLLGSVQDADDALQDALFSAWRGLDSFAGRSTFRAWLYRIATNASLKVAGRRPQRLVPLDYRPATTSVNNLGGPVTEVAWLEPYVDPVMDRAGRAANPAACYESLESVELAFVAALQHLPATQRAVLILRDVLAFSAAEVAETLDLTVAAANSALQRARTGLERRVIGRSQQATLRHLGAVGERALVERFVAAWEQSDVPAILDLLVEDARFTMPPLAAWFAGRAAVGHFLMERVFETSWRLVPLIANGQIAFACYQSATPGEPFTLGALTVLTLSGNRIVELMSFLDPATHRALDLPSLMSS